MYEDDEPTPYDILISNAMNIEEMSKTIRDLTRHVQRQDAALKKMATRIEGLEHLLVLRPRR